MDSKTLTCIICKEILVTKGSRSSQSQTSAVVCGHVFHTKCLYTWLRRNPSCPNCRHPIQDENDIIDKLFFDEDDIDATDGGETSSSPEKERQGDQGIGFGGGLVVGAVVTALAFGIGLLFGGGGNKRKK